MPYVVITDEGTVIYGPRSGKKCREQVRSGLMKGRVKKIKDEEALNLLLDHVIPGGERALKKARKKAKVSEAKFKESDYSYRTGFFDNSEDLEELMKKLEVDKFVVQRDKKGFFALYNDTES